MRSQEEAGKSRMMMVPHSGIHGSTEGGESLAHGDTELME